MLQRSSGVAFDMPIPPTTSNLLLKRLAPSDRAMIELEAEALNARPGAILFELGQPIEYVYFPIDTMIGLENFSGVEVAIAGREGMAGWTAVGGFTHSPYRAIVRSRDGWVLRVPIGPFLAAISSRIQLRLVLTQFAIVSAVQMAEGLGAHLHHRLDAAVVRWLLLRHDRLAGDWISAHHQEIADNLGARRASVTDCLHIIEGEHHVRCRRGRILIRDRPALEIRATGAYGTAESLYRASLGEFGRKLTA